MYPPLPHHGYDSSYIGSAPPTYSSGEFLSPNTSAYPPAAVAGGSTEFDDEPPLLEGIFCLPHHISTVSIRF